MFTSQFKGAEIDYLLGAITSMGISGKFDTELELNEAFPSGDAGFYLVGTDVPYEFYKWDGTEWLSVGRDGFFAPPVL